MNDERPMRLSTLPLEVRRMNPIPFTTSSRSRPRVLRGLLCWALVGAVVSVGHLPVPVSSASAQDKSAQPPLRGPAAVPPSSTPPVPKDAAEPPKIVTDHDVIQEHTLAKLTVVGIPPGHSIIWDVHPFGTASKATNVKLKSVLEFTAPPGQYTVQVRGVRGDDDEVLEAFKTLTIQPRTPTPGPGPGPTPPTPTPIPPTPVPVPPAPISGGGNRALIVYETGQLHPPAQAAIFTSGVVRDYLDAKTVRDAHNPSGAYRIWDQNVNLNHPSVSQSWKDAMARPQSSIPWIVVSNGKTGYEGPLPPDVPQTMALLKKYFGE